MPKLDDYNSFEPDIESGSDIDYDSNSRATDVPAKAFADAIASSANRQEQPWLKTYWRPAIAWVYLITCVFDFILFPIAWSILQAYFSGTVDSAWTPITLHGAGLYHMAMGAAVGVSAYSRGKEKLNDKM